MSAVGVLFVHPEPRGFKGTTDELQEALSTWVPGRRRNADLTPFTYEATIAGRLSTTEENR